MYTFNFYGYISTENFISIPANILGGAKSSEVVKMDEKKEGGGGVKEIDSLNIEIKTMGKAKVVKIEQGLLKDFIPEEKLRNPEMGMSPAVRVHLKSEDGRDFRETIRITMGSNSKLRKWISKYGQLKVGQEVNFGEDSKGFPRVVL
jgi:hypothetical protein